MTDAAESWVEITERLRAGQGKSQDDLAYEARAHGAPAGLNSAWFSKAKQGKRPATIEFLRGIAGALGIPPETFIEYRLALARRELDPKAVGLDRAAANLAALEAAASAGLPGPPPGELEQLLKAATPSRRSRRRSG